MRTTKSFTVLVSLLSLLSFMSLVGLAGCGDPTYSATIEFQGGATMPAVTKYQDTVADAQTGRPIANASVTITNHPSGTVATRYDSAGNVSSAPVVTDSDGWFSVYLTEGLYNITVAAGSVSKQYVGVMVGPATSYGSLDSSVTGFSSAYSSTISYAKIGRLVTIQLPSIAGTVVGTGIGYAQKIPAGYRPASTMLVPIQNTGSAGQYTGSVSIDTDGTIQVDVAHGGPAFPAGSVVIFPLLAVSYLVP